MSDLLFYFSLHSLYVLVGFFFIHKYSCMGAGRVCCRGKQVLRTPFTHRPPDWSAVPSGGGHKDVPLPHAAQQAGGRGWGLKAVGVGTKLSPNPLTILQWFMPVTSLHSHVLPVFATENFSEPCFALKAREEKVSFFLRTVIIVIRLSSGCAMYGFPFLLL